MNSGKNQQTEPAPRFDRKRFGNQDFPVSRDAKIGSGARGSVARIGTREGGSILTIRYI
jgi:hypothetical protein